MSEVLKWAKSKNVTGTEGPVERAKLVLMCAKDVGVHPDTVRRIFRARYGGVKPRISASAPVAQKRKVKGKISVTDYLSKMDPRELLRRALQDLEPTDIVSDSAMHQHACDHYGRISRDDWSELKRLDEFSEYRRREKTGAVIWGHPDALEVRDKRLNWVA